MDGYTPRSAVNESASTWARFDYARPALEHKTSLFRTAASSVHAVARRYPIVSAIAVTSVTFGASTLMLTALTTNRPLPFPLHLGLATNDNATAGATRYAAAANSPVVVKGGAAAGTRIVGASFAEASI